MSEPTKVKLAILVLLGALFTPLAAQAGGKPTTVTSAGTVTIGSGCVDTSTVTSVQAQSVLLIVDTATVAVDTGTYHYYTETNTALWGATYDYGSTQNPVNCAYRDMTGSVSLSRGPFTASTGAQYSETSTIGQNVDFIQYVGNLNLSESAWSHTNACGNTTVPNLNVANACDFTNASKQLNWPRVDTGSSQLVRSGIRSATSLPKTGTYNTPQDAATVFVIVKAKKTTIAAAPAFTSWVATETFTVTSA